MPLLLVPRRDRHLRRSRHALRKPDPSDHDSFHIAFGGRRGVARAEVFALRTLSRSFIGIILLMGIVKKNAIMMIDFALDVERSESSFSRRRHL